MYQSTSALRRISCFSLLPNRAGVAHAFARCFASASKPFAERDIVLLRHKSDPSAQPILTKPLSPDSKIQTHKGALSHGDIIGKNPRDVVQSSSGSEFRLHNVSLSDYVILSKRLVTPIYPADANLIASLFDLHISPASPSSSVDEPRLEILEAGTGHGSLTLHLSRAIHAANPFKPLSENSGNEDTTQQADAAHTGDNEVRAVQDDPLSAWKASRRAVLHTIDVSAKYSKHARKIVSGFRHGLYADNVDFHVGDVSEWVKQELSRRADEQTPLEPSSEVGNEKGSPTPETPFLTHAFLDLPSTHTHLSTVASALQTDGMLVVFNPSITQIAECMQKIKQENIPLYLDQTLELGTNGTSGGREWDVRAVKPRAAKKEEVPTVATTPAGEEDQSARDAEQVKSDVENQTWSLVCRPKVGERVVGGGFLGVFRKMVDRSE